MTMPRFLVPSLCLALAALAAGEADLPKPVPVTVGGDNHQVKTTPKKDINLTPAKEDPAEGVKVRELYFSAFDGSAWGAWQKHGQAFTPGNPIVWSAPEGHWKVYLRKIRESGAALPVPDATTKPLAEFITDRTAPVVAVTFPGNKAQLRGEDKYTVTWTAADPYLRPNPVSVKFSRDGNGTFETVATGLPNNGSYEWTVPKSMTNAGVLRVEVMDAATNVGLAEATGLIIDSIKPRGRVTGPAIAKSQDLALDTEVTKEGYSGLKTARLYVSQDDGTSWTEGPFLAEPWKTVGWKAPADGRFRLAIVATDGAGNQTAAPKGKEGFETIVDTTAPSLQLNSVIGITDAAGGAAKRAFKPDDRVKVVFIAKDANLAANSVAVFLQYSPDKGWIELAKGLPTETAYFFSIPKDSVETKKARIKVIASDIASNVGEVVASETFEIQTSVKEDVMPEFDPNSK